MLKKWSLIVIFLLVLCLLVGCGVSQDLYNAMVDDRDSLKTKLQSVQSELDDTKSELMSVQMELAMTKTELEALKRQLSEAIPTTTPPPPAPSPAPTPAPAPAPTPSPTPAPAPAPAPSTSTEVVTIDIGWPMAKSWDADPELDGIEIQLTPKDAEDRTVETEGVVSARLWLERSFMEGGGKGDLVQEWSGIQVTKDDYDWLMGATIRFEYKGFQPKRMQLGILEVTLVTPDGKSFTARWSSLFLGEL